MNQIVQRLYEIADRENFSSFAKAIEAALAESRAAGYREGVLAGAKVIEEHRDRLRQLISTANADDACADEIELYQHGLDCLTDAYRDVRARIPAAPCEHTHLERAKAMRQSFVDYVTKLERVAAAARKLDEDGTPTEAWNEIMEALAALAPGNATPGGGGKSSASAAPR